MTTVETVENTIVPPSPVRLWLAGVLFAACCATGVVAGYYFGITRSLGVLAIVLVACGFAAFGGLVADWLAEIFDRSQRKNGIASIAPRLGGLEAQVDRLQTALDNMSVGLCMFDADRRLVVSNARCAELYGIAPALVRPGLSPAEILQHSLASASGPAASQTELARKAAEIAEAGRPGDTTVALPDGRLILLGHTPLAGGGWVTTLQDISNRQTA